MTRLENHSSDIVMLIKVEVQLCINICAQRNFEDIIFLNNNNKTVILSVTMHVVICVLSIRIQ